MNPRSPAEVCRGTPCGSLQERYTLQCPKGTPAAASLTTFDGTGTFGQIVIEEWEARTGEWANDNRTRFPHTSIIPVELAHFDAQHGQGNEVRLTWQTASETNNSGAETVRYRLRKIDLDGSAQLSKTVEVRHGRTNHGRGTSPPAKSPSQTKKDAAANATAPLKEDPGSVLLYRREASTIGAAGLNFSVRNEKRCCPRAVTTRKLGAGMRTSQMSDIMEGQRTPDGCRDASDTCSCDGTCKIGVLSLMGN